ncbi:MAG: hypothetical protein WBP43_08255 [Chitinophagales bacterium]|nr:hypothetical protein [Bacteroidota bacterium]
MKKLTGTLIISAVLIAHVGITIATEESYIFSTADYELSAQPAASTPATYVSLPIGNSATGATAMSPKGMFSADDAFFTF